MATAKKSQNPAYPDAHPTAPGGMSRSALVEELVKKHGYENDTEAWKQVSWPDLIDLVVEERLAREAEAREAEPVERPEPDDADDTERIELDLDESDAAHAMADMFDVEDEPDPLAEYEGLLDDEDATSSINADEFMDLIEGVPTGQAEEILHDAGVDSDMLDPEQMFAEMVSAREEHEATLPPPLFIGVPGVRDYVFDGHAGAGPSGAERWMNCTMALTASRRFLETLTPNQQAAFAKAGTAAQQGTTAHNVAEAEANHMLGRITTDELDHTLLELAANPVDDDIAYDDEMAEYVSEYTALVTTYATERGADSILIESRVEAIIPLANMHEGEFYVIRGSLDFAALPTEEDKTLVVGDLKYGKGIDVDVDSNPQIRIYALGLLSEMADDEGNLPDIEEIIYYIAQPRLGGIKRWTESVDDLLAWRDEELSPALTLSLYGEDEGATFNPSDLACQWCPARGSCPALAEKRISDAADLFDAVVDAEFENGPGSLPTPSTLDNQRLSDLLKQIKGLEGLGKALREEAQLRAHRGEQIPDFPLVSYTPPRKWKIESGKEVEAMKVVKGLSPEQKKALFKPRALVTPTQAEKILGESYPVLMELIEVPDKRPVISTGPGDKRKVWEGKPPEQMFDDETGEST